MRTPHRALKIALAENRRGAFLAAVIGVHLVAAWCNGGFLNADEHYQIIEFAQYKLGSQPASALAWEFHERMRPALQPWLAAGVIRGSHALGVTSPFVIAFSLRLFSMMLAVWVTLEVCARWLEPIKVQWVRAVALGASFVLWITPTVHGRFASENWGAALLAGGACLLLETVDVWPTRRTRGVLLAACTGLVWSAAFYCRFQLGLAIGGGLLWALLIRRAPFAPVAIIAAFFAIGCGLNEVLDRWMYDVWTCVPCNYFRVNVVQGKASTFGVSPWWMLAVYMSLILIPPYSLAVLALFVVGSWYARRHVLVWMIAPFMIVHAMLPHKEARFLIPLLYFIGPWFAVCWDALPERMSASVDRWLRTPFGRANVAVMSTINAAALGVAILVPVNDTYQVDRWLWEQGRNGPVTVHTMADSPYRLDEGPVTNSFYRSPNVVLTPLGADGSFRAAPAREPRFVYYKGVEPPVLVASAGACTPLVRTFPAWLAEWEYFQWLTDVRLATICRID